MAKCISLSNYNLSSTNVLIIGAGKGGICWEHCVCPLPGRDAGRGCLCALHPLSPLPCSSLCKGSHQRVFLSLFVLRANDAKHCGAL